MDASPTAEWSGLKRDDLAATLPLLDHTRRRWLREALATAHPGHAWHSELTD